MKAKFLIIFACFFLYGCPSDDGTSDRYYTIENKSDHLLVIKFHQDGNLLEYLTTTLSQNGDHFTENTRFESGTDNFNGPYWAYRSSDSIVIEFDNIKRQIYTLDFINRTISEPIDRNIFRHENYENITKDRFLFKITDEDYYNADDI